MIIKEHKEEPKFSKPIIFDNDDDLISDSNSSSNGSSDLNHESSLPIRGTSRINPRTAEPIPVVTPPPFTASESDPELLTKNLIANNLVPEFACRTLVSKFDDPLPHNPFRSNIDIVSLNSPYFDENYGFLPKTALEREYMQKKAGKCAIQSTKKRKAIAEIHKIVGNMTIKREDEAFQTLLPYKKQLEENGIELTEDVAAAFFQNKTARTNPAMAQYVSRMRGELPAMETKSQNLNVNVNIDDEKAVEIVSGWFEDPLPDEK